MLFRSGRAHGTYEIEKYEWVSMERKYLFSGPGLYMPWITHMLFVDLKDNFSCKEFDRLLCNCSDKGCRENTRKTTRLVCDVTLPATGVEKTDNLPIGITETLHKGSEVLHTVSQSRTIRCLFHRTSNYRLYHICR